MKCDELKAEQWLDYSGEPMPCYPKATVDAAIEELKAKLDEYVLVKLSTQQMLQNLLDCGLIKEWYFNGKFNFVLKADDPHLQIKELNAKLKESEKARYEAGADAADFYQENRRLKRALWLARAERAKDRAITCDDFAYLGDTEREINMTLARTWMKCRLLKPSEWSKVWRKVERKCLKKAEEYK